MRKLHSTANDPQTANGSQNGPQMILDRKLSSLSTAIDPEKKIRMAQFNGSSSLVYRHKKSIKRNKFGFKNNCKKESNCKTTLF